MTEGKSTTDQHIAQATERLRRSWAGKTVPEYNTKPSLSHDDMVLVVPVYLDEHPADGDEPLTVEWFVANLESAEHFPQSEDEPEFIEVAVTARVALSFVRYVDPADGWIVYLLHPQSKAWSAVDQIRDSVKTVSDVRRLFAALGIELTEQPVS